MAGDVAVVEGKHPVIYAPGGMHVGLYPINCPEVYPTEPSDLNNIPYLNIWLRFQDSSCFFLPSRNIERILAYNIIVICRTAIVQ